MRLPRVAVVAALLVTTTALAAPPVLRRYIYERLEPSPLPATPVPEGLGSLWAESCAACHADIAAEWRASRMGRAMTEPVFRADFSMQGESFYCLRCHAPLSEQQPVLVTGLESLRPLVGKGTPNPDFDPVLQSEGVTCVVCHLVEGAMVGGLADATNAPHPTRADPLQVGVEICARCHQLPEPPLSHLDRPLSDTVGEWTRWKAATGRAETCADCHMTAVTRAVAVGGAERASHRHDFGGAWDDALVRQGLVVEGAAWDEGGVRVTLRNEAGHNLPSSEPGRAVVVEAVARAGGAALGAAALVLAKLSPLPKLRDQGDSTLGPAEVREVSVPIPASALAGADEVEVTVRFERLRQLEAVADAAEIPAAARVVSVFSETLRR